MSNLDVLRAMVAAGPEATEQHGTKQLTAETAASAGGEPIGWEDSVSIDGNSTSTASAATRDRDELMDMCAEVSILDLAREDTGEIGRQSGNCVSFHTCPVCGRHDCFRAYPETNSWACFSASNPNADPSKDASGGNVLDYLEHARHMQKTEAVRWLRDRTGHPFQPARQAGHAGGSASASDGAGLDTKDGANIEFMDLSSIVDEPIKPLDEVIVGLLPRERVGQVVARGGSGKTFMAYEAALCVASGREWLGFWCRRGRALFIDPELHISDIHRRVQSIAQAMGISSGDVAGRFDVVSLRGTTATADVLDMAIRQRIAATGKPYDLIIIDSINAILTGDENSSVDVRAFIASLQRLTKDTGAACLVFHHAGKGGGRGAGELARGSSVFLDGPDECMELMPLRVDQGSAADELLKAHTQTKANGEPIYATAWRLTFPKHRTGAPIKPIDLIFRHPMHVVDGTGELEECKVAGSSADYGSRGGSAKGESCQRDWDAMDEALAGIIGDIHAEGNKATRAACLGVLNERRESMGMPKWASATFKNNTLRGGKLRYRVDPTTQELYRLSDEQLAAESDTEGSAVPNTP